MRTTIQRPNGNKINGKSFKSILEEMKKLTDGGNIKVANKHWNIHYKGVSANDINYNNSPIGA
ncbi:hypothetical protein NG767_11265 [Aliarcobacter cryaerophilus]|uniref:hypothetical protein n=1 Tax=Aliarcobacter cryaerophilus TaxID=28198 RepID=UPI003DA461A6